jgi:hypothetical protein
MLMASAGRRCEYALQSVNDKLCGIFTVRN